MKRLLFAIAIVPFLIIQDAHARDQIRIVGSSTVYPFSASAAERFGRDSEFKTPVVESTGTGGGIKLFCSGIGPNTPDIANASRHIQPEEVSTCAKNGVRDILEISIGFDGIVLANSIHSPHINLTREQLFMALAKQLPVNGKLVDNPYIRWKQVDTALPDLPIEVYGPAPTSGTRDAFVEIVMEKACKKFTEFKEAYPQEKAYKGACGSIREDGHYLEAGENDNVIVQKLISNQGAFGIFGYSSLEENASAIQAADIDGVPPTYENIHEGKYAVSRELFVYVKQAHAGMIPGLKEFLGELTSEDAFGPEGYLAAQGLISLNDERRMKARAAVGLLGEEIH